MGSGSSKVSLNLLKPSNIVNRKVKKNYVLSPRLCVAIFKQTNGSCSEKDIEKLRDFISRPMNMKFFGAAKCKVSEKSRINNQYSICYGLSYRENTSRKITTFLYDTSLSDKNFVSAIMLSHDPTS